MHADTSFAVFVVGGVLAFVNLATVGLVILYLIGGLMMVGAVAAGTRRRRLGPAPEVTLRPGGVERPWRRGRDVR